MSSRTLVTWHIEIQHYSVSMGRLATEKVVPRMSSQSHGPGGYPTQSNTTASFDDR